MCIAAVGWLQKKIKFKNYHNQKIIFFPPPKFHQRNCNSNLEIPFQEVYPNTASGVVRTSRHHQRRCWRKEKTQRSNESFNNTALIPLVTSSLMRIPSTGGVGGVVDVDVRQMFKYKRLLGMNEIRTQTPAQRNAHVPRIWRSDDEQQQQQDDGGVVDTATYVMEWLPCHPLPGE